MLPTDWSAPSGYVLRRLSDARVQQYWDPNHVLATQMKKDAGPPQPAQDCCERSEILWDLAAVYPTGSVWSDRMPPAVVFNGPVVDVIDAIEKALAPSRAIWLPMPVRQPRADVKLIPIRIHDGHAAQSGQALVWGFLHSDTLSPELVEPGVDVGHVQMNQAAYRAIAGVFSQKKRQSVAGHLRKDGKARFEPVFPIDVEPEAVDVERLAPRVVSHP
jgi:hypothetical protein